MFKKLLLLGFTLFFVPPVYANWATSVISSWEGEESTKLTASAWSFPDQVIKIDSENRSVFVYNQFMTNGYGNRIYSCEAKFVVDDQLKKIESTTWSSTAMPTVTAVSIRYGDACSYYYASLKYLAPKAWKPKIVHTGAYIEYRNQKPFLIFRDNRSENFKNSGLKIPFVDLPKALLLNLDDKDCSTIKCELGNQPKYTVTIRRGNKIHTFDLLNYLYPKIYLSFSEIQLGQFLHYYRDEILPFNTLVEYKKS